jgi:HSP20 family molecular chaperone IbpA
MASNYKKNRLTSAIMTFADQLASGAEPISAQTDILGEASQVQMDVYETPKEVVVELDLPGADPADINVLIQGGWLIVEGVKKETEAPPAGPVRYLCIERYFGSVKRTIKLPVDIDAVATRAVYRDGVLRITLPRTEGGTSAHHIIINGK